MKTKKYKNPKLAIAWYYDKEDDKNFATFIFDSNGHYEIEKEFLKYANKYNEWGVKEKDIIDIFVIDTEEDNKGRDYKISIV